MGQAGLMGGVVEAVVDEAAVTDDRAGIAGGDGCRGVGEPPA